MRKILLLTLATTILLGACKNKTPKGANGETYSSATEYNDYIVDRQMTLMKRVMSFSQMAQINLDSAANMLDGFVKETSTMVKEIKGMPPYKGDSTLRDASANLFGFYRKIFDNEYRDILQLRKEQDGTSVEIQDRIEALVKGIEDEEKGYDRSFQAAQKAFAAKNNMRIIENPMQKEFDKKVGRGE